MPMRSQGYCGDGRGLSGLRWGCRNGRGPYLEGRQEPQASSLFLTPTLRPQGPCRVGSGESGLVLSEEGNPACLSSCSGGLRPLVELCVEPAGVSRRCTEVSVPLLVVPSPTGLPSKRGPGIGFLSRADLEIGVVQHVAPPTILRLEFPSETGLILRHGGKVGNPFQTKQGNRPSCRDQEGRRGSEKLCLEPRCSHRGRPVCRGTFGLHQVYQVPYQTSRWNVRLLLIRCSRKGLHLAMTGDSRGFSRVVAGFSSYYRECRLPLVLAQEIPIFHSSCEGELGIALESLQGKIDLI